MKNKEVALEGGLYSQAVIIWYQTVEDKDKKR